jgi:hypothetical protein
MEDEVFFSSSALDVLRYWKKVPGLSSELYDFEMGAARDLSPSQSRSSDDNQKIQDAPELRVPAGDGRKMKSRISTLKAALKGS